MAILLLVCAVVQLVIPAPSASPDATHISLNHIMMEAGKCEDIFTRVSFLFLVFLSDVFFCKVHMILSKHEKSEPKKNEQSLVRYLGTYINNTNIDCPEVLKTVKNSTVTRPITALLKNIVKCSKKKNFRV
uniref:Interleukin-4 n=1 Tax=Poecilia latipinna TaxID=48699 RepID=A0A3B3UJS9_9TELE